MAKAKSNLPPDPKKTRPEDRLPFENRFKKGVSGNPGGRPKTPAHLVDFKKRTYEDFLTALHRLGDLTREQFKIETTKKEATMFEGMFQKMFLQAHDGCRHARAEIIDRLWGKVKEIHQIESSDSLEDKIKSLSKEKQEQLIELLREASLRDTAQ